MARTKTIPIITGADSEGTCWICRRGDSPYFYLKGTVKRNEKWKNFQKSLKTSDFKAAMDRAYDYLKGKDFKKTLNKEKDNVRALEQWVDEFLLGYVNSNTKREYERDLAKFIDFLNKNYPDVGYVHQIEYKHVKRFETHEKNRPNTKHPDMKVSENTIKGELKSISSWLAEARKHKYTKERPFEDFSVGAITAKKEVFYPDEVKKILKAAKKKNSLLYAVIILLFQRGLRLEEIIYAEREHFKEESRMLEIPETKEKYPKKIYLPKRSFNAICKLFRKGKYLFPNPHSSGKDVWVKLDRDIRKFCNSLGIKGNPHKFRHTYCSYSLKCGANPMDVARAMGHRRLMTTQGYYHIIGWKIDDEIKRIFGDWE